MTSREVPRVVTLITGDRVRATAPDTFAFEPAAGRENIGYTTRTVWNGDDRDVVVMPADAAALVAAGTRGGARRRFGRRRCRAQQGEGAGERDGPSDSQGDSRV